MLVAKVEKELELEQGEFQLSQPKPDVITILQAMQDNLQEWKASLRFKLKLLIKARTFKILKGLPLLKVTPRSCKIVLKNKMHTDNTIARYKAKVIIRGFEQQYGIDYQETFALVI